MKSTLALLALLTGLALALPAASQIVSFSQPPPLAEGMPALPRITGPLTPAMARINAALAKEDASWRDMIKFCSDNAGDDAEVDRSVQVAMRGPAYLSITMGYSYDCGGAHPNAGETALTYSLKTGAPVDWSRLLPKSLIDAVSTDSAGDGTTIGLISSKALRKIYTREALAGLDADSRNDCADAVADDGLTFQLWLDAKAGALMMAPDLPHVVFACGDPQPVSIADLRRLGVGAPLLAALKAAHADTH